MLYLTTEDLCSAARSGDLPTVQKCIEESVDINGRPRYTNTALALAVGKRHLKVVKYLLANNADVDLFYKSSPPVSLAVQNGYKDILKLLLEKKPNLNIVHTYNESSDMTPLMLAIERECYDEEIVNMLLKGGADVNFCNYSTPLTAIVRKNRINLVKIFIEFNADVNQLGTDGCSPLKVAISNKNLEMVKYLLENGADPNLMLPNGSNYLSAAIVGGNLEVVKYFLDKGADPNVKSNDGSTCLSYAMKNKNLNILEYLINYFQKKGTPALHLTSKHGNVNDVTYLISKGVDINATDVDGNTALTFAIKNRKTEVVEHLIKNGADVCKFLLDGQSPLSAAVEINDTSLVNQLLTHGAQPSIQTSFRAAIENGNLPLVQLLKEKGAEVDARYRDGHSCLTAATEKELEGVIKYLLQQGAQIDQFDRQNRNALRIAASKCNFPLVRFLLESGANPELAKDELEIFAAKNEDFWFFLEKLGVCHTSKDSGHEEAP